MTGRLRQLFAQLPIRHKLRFMITVTSGISLGLACAGFLGYELSTFRSETLERVESLAELVARSSRAAVSFRDPEAAERMLAALSGEEYVIAACILDDRREPFALYRRAPDGPTQTDARCFHEADTPLGHRFADGELHLHVPILIDDREAVGSLVLHYALTAVYEKAARYALIVAAVMASSMILAFVMSQWLQGVVSRPIGHLADVARRVTLQRDYGVRADKYHDDEIGLLIDSFNEMLGKIEDRDRALERHRGNLEQQVVERTQTLAAQNESLRQEIHARRKAEAALRTAERDTRMLMEQASEGIVITDPRGSILAVNPAGCEMLGYDPIEIAGMRFSQLLPPGEINEPETLYAALESGQAVLAERRFQRKNGSFVWTETSLKRLGDGRMQAIVRDVTERKELEEQLRHSQKMEAVGQLAAGVAHEINNPMAFVRSNLSLLRKEWVEFGRAMEALGAADVVRSAFDECAELIDDSLEGVDRVVSIVRDVKEFTHLGRHERTLADVREVLEGVLRLATPRFAPDLEIVREYGDVPLVSCVVDQMRQVFLNLLVNASDALDERGTIRIRTEVCDGNLVVAIADDGSGIPDEIAERLFDPFFTTKAPGEGTGLGLAISYDIVRRHGGSIVFDSTPGEGTEFRVLLPIEGAG